MRKLTVILLVLVCFKSNSQMPAMASYFGSNNSWLLQKIETRPWGAYSFRKLNVNSTKAVRIRRASDNAESDFGFNAKGYFDSTTYNSFVSGTTARVVVWYDQSGRNHNLMQGTATSQPYVTRTANGSFCVSIIGSGITLNTDSAITNFRYACFLSRIDNGDCVFLTNGGIRAMAFFPNNWYGGSTMGSTTALYGSSVIHNEGLNRFVWDATFGVGSSPAMNSTFTLAASGYDNTSIWGELIIWDNEPSTGYNADTTPLQYLVLASQKTYFGL